MMRRLFACLFACLPVAAFAAETPKVVTPGELTWGVSTTFAPFEFQKDGKVVGFDVDMMDEIGRRIGLKSNLLSMDYAGIIPALSTGHRIDAAVSGIYITPQRLEVIDMVPYLIIGDQIVAPAANPGKLTGKDELCGHHMVVVVNTNFEAKLKALSAACTAAAKPAIDILSIANSAAVALALAQGRGEGALSSAATIVSMMTTNPGAYIPIGEPFDVNTKVGIGIAKDNPVLKTQVEGALDAMGKDGTYTGLLKKWGLSPTSSIF
jgi:polar amino acid transport system substrate-binding protein